MRLHSLCPADSSLPENPYCRSLCGGERIKDSFDLSLDSYTYEKFICQNNRDRITCYGGRKIKITRAYYGRKQMFKCGVGLDTNCEAEESEAKVTLLNDVPE